VWASVREGRSAAGRPRRVRTAPFDGRAHRLCLSAVALLPCVPAGPAAARQRAAHPRYAKVRRAAARQGHAARHLVHPQQVKSRAMLTVHAIVQRAERFGLPSTAHAWRTFFPRSADRSVCAAASTAAGAPAPHHVASFHVCTCMCARACTSLAPSRHAAANRHLRRRDCDVSAARAAATPLTNDAAREAIQARMAIGLWGY
jgi:hypothetical protein